jgi:peptide/nickel transport system substrate-binding protein
MFVVCVVVGATFGASACVTDDQSAPPDSSATESTTTPERAAPRTGGAAVALVVSDVAGLDPVKGNGVAAGDGQRLFAIYGALLALDSRGEMDPVLAVSLRTIGAAPQRWRLVLRTGIFFSDGSPFDATAVAVNWQRAKEPANQCPCFAYASTITSTSVVDAHTLDIELLAPNAHFDKIVERSSLNYIASAKAIAERADLVNKPVGAGPFLLETWHRDNRMELRRNPSWAATPGPYLDRLTFVVIPDERQRVDTFLTNGADTFYTATRGSVSTATEGIKGSTYAQVPLTTAQTLLFNTRRAPFDDARVRKAVVQSLDLAVLAHDILDKSIPAENFTVPGSRWFDPAAELPRYDPAAAQHLVDAYVSEHDGAPITFTWIAFSQALDQQRANFLQTSLNQLKNIRMNIETYDASLVINKVLFGRDFQAASWGFPIIDPEPVLYSAVKSDSPLNLSGYRNADVDRAVVEARTLQDDALRKGLYDRVWEALARDLPYVPYLVVSNGFVCSPRLRHCSVFGDGIMRWDLVWFASR